MARLTGALTYDQLSRFTGGAVKAPAGVQPTWETSRKPPLPPKPTPKPAAISPRARRYATAQAAIAEREQAAKSKTSVAQPTFEEQLASFQAASQAQIEQATAPLLQTIADLQRQQAEQEQKRAEDLKRQEEAQRAAAVNQQRSQVASNLQIQPAATPAPTASTAASTFKTSGPVILGIGDILPSAVNI